MTTHARAALLCDSFLWFARSAQRTYSGYSWCFWLQGHCRHVTVRCVAELPSMGSRRAASGGAHPNAGDVAHPATSRNHDTARGPTGRARSPPGRAANNSREAPAGPSASTGGRRSLQRGGIRARPFRCAVSSCARGCIHDTARGPGGPCSVAARSISRAPLTQSASRAPQRADQDVPAGCHR